MPAKLPKTVTIRDMGVLVHHEMNGCTLEETAKKLGVSRDTVKRTKRRAAYRDLVLAALEEKGFDVPKYVDKLIGLTDAERDINIGGQVHLVPDNVARMAAIKKIGDIYGDSAPKELSHTHSLTASSDDELGELLEEAERNLVLGTREGDDSGDSESI